MRYLLICLLAIGCSKKSEEKPWLPDPTEVPPMAASEIKRGQDACTAYVGKICDCAKRLPDRKDVGEACKLASGYPEAIEVGLNVANNPESTKRDNKQSQDMVRKTMAKCIEEAGKLTLLGC